jgi:methionyl aminopeptidase
MSIIPKNSAEIDSMRRGGKILGIILKDLADYLQPGMSTHDLEMKAEELFKKHDVLPGFKGYHGYSAILCTSVNDEAVHSIPNKTPLEKGDILSIDCGVLLDRLNTDSAIAVIVGGSSTPEAERFVKSCKKALWLGIEQVRPGNKIGDIGNAIETYVKKMGYKVIPELTGHGIGYTLHEPPYVPNHGKKGKGMSLKPGMTIAIEPILSMGSQKIDTLDDGWTIVTRDGSLAMQHEHTILVTDSGYEVLTLRPGEKALI